MPVSPVCSVSFRPAAGGGPRTPAVSSAPHPRTRGRCGSPAGLHPLIPVTSMRLPLPGADCDGSFPRKSARNSRPAPLGALRPFLILKSKSGRPVSLNPILEPRLRYHLEQTLQGCKLLIPDGVPTHQDITVLQAFRSYAQEPDSTRSMASHGLRHTYAVECYEANISLCGPKGRGPGSSAMGGTM